MMKKMMKEKKFKKCLKVLDNPLKFNKFKIHLLKVNRNHQKEIKSPTAEPKQPPKIEVIRKS